MACWQLCSVNVTFTSPSTEEATGQYEDSVHVSCHSIHTRHSSMAMRGLVTHGITVLRVHCTIVPGTLYSSTPVNCGGKRSTRAREHSTVVQLYKYFFGLKKTLSQQDMRSNNTVVQSDCSATAGSTCSRDQYLPVHFNLPVFTILLPEMKFIAVLVVGDFRPWLNGPRPNLDTSTNFKSNVTDARSFTSRAALIARNMVAQNVSGLYLANTRDKARFSKTKHKQNIIHQ